MDLRRYLWYNRVMSEDSKVPEESVNTEDVTPKQAEALVSTAVEEIVPAPADGLLIEEDGDPFWVIQRVFWGIIKTAALLGLLLFLIWLVWRPSSFLSKETSENFEIKPAPVVEVETPKEEREPGWFKRLFTSEKKDTPLTPTNQAPVGNNNSNKTPSNAVVDDANAVQVAYDLEADRTLLVRGIIPESISWLRRAKTVGEISMSMLRQSNPSDRSRQVEEILAASDLLFVESANLRAQLRAESDYFLKEGTLANDTTAALEIEIAAALQALDPVPVESLVAEKIKSQQSASAHMSNAKIRDTLYRNIQTFDRLLRQQSIPLLNPATEIRAS